MFVSQNPQSRLWMSHRSSWIRNSNATSLLEPAAQKASAATHSSSDANEKKVNRRRPTGTLPVADTARFAAKETRPRSPSEDPADGLPRSPFGLAAINGLHSTVAQRPLAPQGVR